MTPLRRRMIEDMQLRGFSARTQEAYVHGVSRLARHYGRSPDLITEERSSTATIPAVTGIA